MKFDDLDHGDADLLKRYREASEAEPAQPNEATRSAILAEARRVADIQARPEAVKPFDRRAPAANEPRWRFAAVGSVAAVLIAVILMVPAYRQGQGVRALQRPDAPPAVARLDESRDAVAPREAPAAVNAPTLQLEEFDRNPRPMAKIAAGAPSRDKAREEQAANADLARASTQRQRASADAALAQADVPPTAQLAPAAPPAYAPVPSQSLARASRRGEPAPLLAAVRAGNLDEVTRLLASGASVAEADDEGRSPLLLAVLAQRGDLVRALLARGADPDAADRAGQTPLAAAHARHLDDISAALKQAGARR